MTITKRHKPKPTDLYDHPDSEFRRTHILLNKVFDAKGCKCRVEGHGTIPSPVIILYCKQHEAAPELGRALQDARSAGIIDDFGNPSSIERADDALQKAGLTRIAK